MTDAGPASSLRPGRRADGPAARRELVVYCAGTSWDGVTGSDAHMARQLSRHVDVLFVDPAVSFLSHRSLRRLRALGQPPWLERVDDRLVRLSPVVLPGLTRPLVHRTTAPLVRRAIERSVQAMGAEVRAVVVSTLDDLLDVCGAPRRVFYGTDDYVAGARLMGLRESVLRTAEVRQLRKATHVLAVSPELRAQWSRPGREAVLLTNGCDVDTFARTDAASRPTDLHLDGPVAGVVGQITARIDLRLLEAVAGSGCALLLVGPIDPSFEPARMKRLLRLANVQAVGRRPFDQLPAYLSAIDVGLTPYAESAFNRASFPLKTLEYLAAGRPVVSTDLPAARWLGTDLIRVATTPADFVAATWAAASEARTPEAVQARQSFARVHSWQRRGDQLSSLILDGSSR